ncbi:fucolectin-4-like [Amphiura filiformis]|uniref:fucolectin-4-like n=1 Tax=Amphiura filiformis TaxID=82378 RepID=UPI003B20D4C2
MNQTECVGNVVIYNRVDCCKYRLEGAIVRVGFDCDKANNPICGHVTRHMIDQNQRVDVLCNQALMGKYISIRLPVDVIESMILCEVEWYTGTCEG